MRKWTKEEIEFLKNNYEKLPYSTIKVWVRGICSPIKLLKKNEPNNSEVVK